MASGNSFFIKSNGVLSPFSNFNITAAAISRKNAAVDALKISFATDSLYSDFQVGQTIEIFDQNVRIFYGSIAKLNNNINSSSHILELLALNPWSDLERIVYQQLWKSADTASGTAVLTPTWRSKVVLGQNSIGEKISVAAVLTDILSYAISCGANFQIGTVDVDAQMVLDEATDLSCAEALARTAKWSPNISVFFDYSHAGLPKLNIIKKSSMLNTDIDVNNGFIKSLEITPRPDLAVAGVAIKYEKEHTEGEFTWLALEEDVYPAGFNSAAKNAIVMSVQLAGNKASAQVHSIKCKTIQPNSAAWWKEKVAALDADATNIEVLEYERVYSHLPRELVEGTIAAQMNYAAETDYIKAKLAYIDSSGSEVTKTVGVHTVATNAVTGNYTSWTTTQLQEDTPVGLAKAIYDAASSLLFEGKCVMIGGNINALAGKKVSFLNATELWASMQSPITAIDQDLKRNLITIRFGPPKHLYHYSIAELFRINRQRTVALDSFTRATGNVATAAIKISGASSDTNGSQGDTEYARLVIQKENKFIDMNSNDLPENGEVKFREVLVCHNGFLATVKVLMSNPYTIL